jgi:CheY-like chemotaxis protein
MLADLGHVVSTAVDAVTARSMLESKERIDLLLTDVVMPNGASGIELARDAQQLRPALKVIAMSGYLREAPNREIGLPDVIFLEKPFLRAQLAEAITAAFAAGPMDRHLSAWNNGLSTSHAGVNVPSVFTHQDRHHPPHRQCGSRRYRVNACMRSVSGSTTRPLPKSDRRSGPLKSSGSRHRRQTRAMMAMGPPPGGPWCSAPPET